MDKTNTVSYVSVKKGDHVSGYMKDGQNFNMAVTEIDLDQQIITGQPFLLLTDLSSPDQPIIDIKFSDIESIYIGAPISKQVTPTASHEATIPPKSEPPVALGLLAYVAQLWAGMLLVGFLF